MDKKIRFRATAINPTGLTFEFTFLHWNWNGIQDAANIQLSKIVNSDPLHLVNGPWEATRIDRA